VQLTERFAIPIWLEGRVGAERAALLRDPVFQGRGVPRGDGAPVLLIPGFLAGDVSLGLMAHWLKELGYRPGRAHLRANVGCSERVLGHLDAHLDALATRHGRPVRIVGQSRGGSMARVLAVRRPDIVESIVTLGSPLTDEFAVHPFVRNQVRAVALLGSLGVPGLFSYGCRGECCAGARRDLAAPFPDGVRFTSVYSRTDGIVAWRVCLDPAARHVEVRSSHIGMAANADVFRAIGEALAPAAAGGALGLAS
jgi:pimeloyl-ACP methyl ester carboxylesterase